MGSPSRQGFNSGGDSFSHGVDRVGSHSVPTVNQQVDDEHGAEGCGELAYFNVFATSAECDHAGGDVVAKGHEFILGVKDVGGCLLNVSYLENLDLSDHDGVVVVGGKTSMPQTPLGHVGCGRYNARFFQAKGHQVVLSIDDKVGGDSNR